MRSTYSGEVDILVCACVWTWRKLPVYSLKRPSHTGTTHGPRTEKVAILASASSFAGCASPCATRVSSALDQRYAFVVVRCVRRDFRTCTKMCAAQKCARSSAHECTRPGAIPNPESESKDESESESGFDSGFGFMCSGIGFGVGIV